MFQCCNISNAENPLPNRHRRTLQSNPTLSLNKKVTITLALLAVCASRLNKKVVCMKQQGFSVRQRTPALDTRAHNPQQGVFGKIAFLGLDPNASDRGDLNPAHGGNVTRQLLLFYCIPDPIPWPQIHMMQKTDVLRTNVER
jgi:hypothetical protein